MVIVARTLGFAGVGLVDNVQVLVTSGNMNKEKTISYINPLSMPPPGGVTGTESRAKVKYADGTIIINGSIGFDLNAQALSLVSTQKLMRRGYSFPVDLFDGAAGYRLLNCYAQSLTLSGSVGGLISGSVTFISGEDWRRLYSSTGTFNRERTPFGYWASGNTNVKDWTMNFNQAVEPVYLNGDGDEDDDEWPKYIKVGAVEISLEVTTYEQFFAHDTIAISAASFTLTGDTRSEAYSFSGPADLGGYAHSFDASASLEDGSDAIIIS